MICSICNAPLAQQPDQASPRYQTCSGCGTLQLVPLPQFESNAAFQGDDVAHHMAETDRQRGEYLRRRLRMLGTPGHRATSTPGAGADPPRLLDVGCSTGELMRLAREIGWAADGIELSDELAAIARTQNPGSTVISEDILALDPDTLTRYHAIVALDVIEHVLCPRSFVQRLSALLLPGGTMLIQTPNARSLRARLHGDSWNMLLPEYHFHLFTPASLRQLLTGGAGLHVMQATTASGTGTETGMRALVAHAKEAALAAGMLGNALLVVCRKPN